MDAVALVSCVSSVPADYNHFGSQSPVNALYASTNYNAHTIPSPVTCAKTIATNRILQSVTELGFYASGTS
jgi:hypothetical protein